jgi:hypothetical protein
MALDSYGHLDGTYCDACTRLTKIRGRWTPLVIFKPSQRVTVLPEKPGGPLQPLWAQERRAEITGKVGTVDGWIVDVGMWEISFPETEDGVGYAIMASDEIAAAEADR